MKNEINIRLEFGKRLKTFREARGWSQDKLAQICGWSSNTRVSGYERGANEPSLDDIGRLAQALGVYPEVLAYGADSIAMHLRDALNTLGVASTSGDDIDLIGRIQSDLESFRKQQRKRGGSR
jgi:transcriptional regulator with XRE-family HTH domain